LIRRADARVWRSTGAGWFVNGHALIILLCRASGDSIGRVLQVES
jgi:hypothetical protein